MASPVPTVALALALLATLMAGVHSHGSLTVPRSRNVINPMQGQTWWKDHGNGHGDPVRKPIWGPGVCGDPYQHVGTGQTSNPGAHYANMITGNQATYSSGSVINVQWHIQVNHGGRIGVKICPSKQISQACFDQHPLMRADVNDRYVYIMSGASMGTLGTMSANFRLPAGVSCSGGCVLQWEYLTMNSCFEPCNRAVCGVYADRRNPVTGQSNMGTCCLGCDAANVPEIFRNCADITITSGGTTPPPPGNPCDKCNLPVTSGGCKCDRNCNCLSTPPPPGNPCDKCNLPVSSGGCKCDSNCNCLPTNPTCSITSPPGGACGSGRCCPSGQCCSQFGWCGTTTAHCGAGCQRSWGACTGAAAAAGALPRTNRRGRFGQASNTTLVQTEAGGLTAEETPVAATSTMDPSKFGMPDEVFTPQTVAEPAAAAVDPAAAAVVAAAAVDASVVPEVAAVPAATAPAAASTDSGAVADSGPTAEAGK